MTQPNHLELAKQGNPQGMNTMIKWMVLIEGEEVHLSKLTEQLSSSECNVIEENGNYYLTSSQFDSLALVEDVRLCTHEILQSIQGADLIKIGGICKKHEDGRISCNRLLSATLKTDNSSATIEGFEIRSHLSFSHIKAAAHLANLSYEIEADDDGKRPSGLFYVHRAYVVGCIITAASYLEATINEVLADIAEDPDAAAWMETNRIDKKPILDKYDIVFDHAEKDLFCKGAEPYQSASSLIDLRNRLVHYKPEWVGTGEGYKETFSEKLRERLEKKIKKLNPLADAGNCSFFPHKCLSYGCAKWAVESSIKFTDEFFLKLGLPSNLNEDTRAELNLPKIE